MVGLTVAAPVLSLFTDIEVRKQRSKGRTAAQDPLSKMATQGRQVVDSACRERHRQQPHQQHHGHQQDGVATCTGCGKRLRQYNNNYNCDVAGHHTECAPGDSGVCSCATAHVRPTPARGCSMIPCGARRSSSTGCCSRRKRGSPAGEGAGQGATATQSAGEEVQKEEQCSVSQGPKRQVVVSHSNQQTPHGWADLVTPPPLPMYPRSRQPGGHGAAAGSASGACSPHNSAHGKSWNSSAHRVFSGPSALVSSYTMTECQGPHPHWEDRHVVFQLPGRFIVGIFDGHGRSGFGRVASEFCSARVQRHLTARSPLVVSPTKGGSGAAVDSLGGTASQRSDRFHSAFLCTDKEFLQEHPAQASHSGTTALVVAVGRASLCVANAGDCRAVLSRAGRAVDLSTDHKPSLPAEFARIRAAGGRIVRPDPQGPLRVCSPDGRTGLAVSRGLGDHSFKDPRHCVRPLLDATPDVREVALRRGEDELLVMASDGLWDVMSSQQAVDMARSVPSAHLASDLLAKEAIACGSQDNVTVVVVRL